MCSASFSKGYRVWTNQLIIIENKKIDVKLFNVY